MFVLSFMAFTLAVVLWVSAIFSEPLREALAVWLVAFGWVFFVAGVLALAVAVTP